MIFSKFLFAAALLGAPLCFAVDTRSWTHSSRQDFENGTLKNLSLRSDGRLMLAPVFRELADPGTAYLWALAADSKGNLYAGGGGPGGSSTRLTAVDASGKARTVADVPGLQIQAIAIDRRDRVYVGTAPDGKVYRIDNGKPQVFYDPKAKYIWAMAFNSRGDLFVATGDAGEIHRVAADGTGSVFFRTEETHARSLTVDAKDNLIAGTEPGGLVLRISPAGEGFVLHQSPKREVTAVAVTAQGVIYAGAVGTKTAGGTGAPSLSIAVPVAPAPAPAGAPAARPATVQPVPIPPASASSPPPASVSGGSEVYRIGTDGYAQRVWMHAQDVVYAIAIDSQNRPVIGTGNKGNIYRVETDQISTLLINAAPSQITAMTTGSDGRVYAATGNVGKVYQIGPGLEASGTYESDPLDAGSFAWWGRVRQKGLGTAAAVETRSGNLDRPQKNWSPWAPLDTAGRVSSPAARFLQYRITLTGGSELREIELAWMPRNVAPSLDEIDITPANYRFPPPSALTASVPQTLNLPPLGQRRRTVPALSLDTGSSAQSMQYARGFLGARWAATDPNGDELIYKVEIRGVNEREWKLLRDKVKERFVAWDATAYPDGEYILRVTASDSPDNPPGSALSTQLESERFTVDNTSPRISGLTGTRTGTGLNVKWSARDDRSVISRAEYSLNGTDWVVVEPATRLSDAPQLDYALTVPNAGGAETTIAVRVTDEYDNQSVEKVIVR
jgi:hypothetical protein